MLGRVQGWLIAAAAGVAAVVGYGALQRRKGRQKATHDAMRSDINRANQIEDQADEARRNRDTSAPVDDRLRGHGRLRD